MKLYRAAAIFLMAILASGCMSVSTDAHITGNAEIEKVDYKIEIDKDTYEIMAAGQNSQNSSQLIEGENQVFNYSSSEMNNYTEEGNKVFEATFYDVKPKNGVNLSVYKEEGKVVFEDPNFALTKMSQNTRSNPDSDSTTQFSKSRSTDSNTHTVQFSGETRVQESNTTSSSGQGLQQMEERLKNSMNITYRVHMPGPITETTGEIKEENTVVYNMSDMYEATGPQQEGKGVYVKSEVSGGGIVSSVVSFFTGLI